VFDILESISNQFYTETSVQNIFDINNTFNSTNRTHVPAQSNSSLRSLLSGQHPRQ